MTDFSRYVGLPYAEGARGPESFDCWGLLVRVYREVLGVTLSDLTEGERAARALGGWRETAAPALMDAALFEFGTGPHVGVVVGADRVLHAHAGLGRSAISRPGGMLLPRAPRYFRLTRVA